MRIHLILTILRALSGSMLTAQTKFPKTCADGTPIPPFAAIQVARPIDTACGISGKPASASATLIQNAAKNNFCSTGPVTDTTHAELMALQAKAAAEGIPFGQTPPPDRAALQQLGEGRLVGIKAFLIEAHHADVDTGETVHCNRTGEVNSDIHMALGAEDSDRECSSVTAEISPHFRPNSWNEIGHFEIFDPTTKQYTPNPVLATRLQSRAYRITGQLFFDAAHVPCPCGTTCAPERSSLWEIHPVYAIDVCKLGTGCLVDSDSDWVPFDQWWAPVKGPHRHDMGPE